MKKQAILLALAATLLFTACAPAAPSQPPQQSSSAQTQSAPPSTAQSEPAQRTSIKLASLKGPTTMGAVKLMSDVKNGTARHDYSVEMFGSAEEISPKLVKGEIDGAIIPSNLASVLYNKTQGEIVVAAINNLGVLYILSDTDEIKSVADLKGKQIHTTGKGTTPEYILGHIIKENNLAIDTDVVVNYYSEATQAANGAMLSSTQGNIVMLPQPYVQSFIAQTQGKYKIVLDMNEEWEKVSPDSKIVTGVLVLRKSFIEQNEQAVAELLEDYKQSIEYTKTNTAEAAQLIAEYSIVPKAELAEKALPYCALEYIEGADMQTVISGYLQVLFNQNPQAVGGKLPDDDFYYKAKE